MRLVVVLIALATLLAGCASTVRGTSPKDAPTTNTRGVAVPPPDQLVFQVDIGGGYWQQEYAATARPVLSVYGDGTVYVVADRASGSPGTPVRFERAEVPRADLLDLIARARRAGLFDGHRVDTGTPNVTDMGSTSVFFRPAAAPGHTVSAYALQYTEGDRDLGDWQRRTRRLLRDLIRSADGAVTRPRPWTPDRIDVTELKIYTRTSNPQPWSGPPLDTVLKGAADRRCGVVTGTAARKVYETALEHGNLHWRESADVRTLAIRPLLPGESGC